MLTVDVVTPMTTSLGVAEPLVCLQNGGNKQPASDDTSSTTVTVPSGTTSEDGLEEEEADEGCKPGTRESKGSQGAR